MSPRIFHRLSRLDVHHRFVVTAAFAAIAFLCVTGRISFVAQLIVAWDAYAICFLSLAWLQILNANARELVRIATVQHASRLVIFTFVLAAACASMGAVIYLLNAAKGLPKEPFASHVLGAIATVILSWLVVHTVFTLHYAYLFYIHPDEAGNGGGVQFPAGEEKCEPDYLDFAYFSFVIGMTSQVSDVQVVSRKIRRWVLLHGLISFAFNTTILALGINIVSGMI